MPANGSGSRSPDAHSFRQTFKGARHSVAARLALKIKLTRLSHEECREVLDYIEVMQSLGAWTVQRPARDEGRAGDSERSPSQLTSESRGPSEKFDVAAPCDESGATPSVRR